MNDTIQKAREFCDKYGVVIIVEFHFHGPYFLGDEDITRDTYKVTIKRGEKQYQTVYGQSTLYSKYTNIEEKQRVIGMKCKDNVRREPDPYDILASLEKYPLDSFEDWCKYGGYNSDSIKALTTYTRCVGEWLKIKEMFGEEGEVIEALRDIT